MKTATVDYLIQERLFHETDPNSYMATRHSYRDTGIPVTWWRLRLASMRPDEWDTVAWEHAYVFDIESTCNGVEPMMAAQAFLRDV
jgi:hypothetical protein